MTTHARRLRSHAHRSRSISALALLSGGIDSSACVRFYLDLGCKVSCLFVDYGQAAAIREYAAATSVSAHYGVKLQRIRCAGLPPSAEGFIQGRNAFLLFCALMAFQHESGLVAIGVHSNTRYVDCKPSFIKEVQRMFDFYCQGSIRVEAPFLIWDKRQIWQYCLENNVPLSKTYSCERGLAKPCGRCLSCKDIERLS